MPGFGDFSVGLVLTAVCVFSVGLGAVALRRRLTPGLSGSPARVADVVLVVGILTVVLLSVGAVGLLTRAAVVVACVLGGGLSAAVARRLPADPTAAAVGDDGGGGGGGPEAAGPGAMTPTRGARAIGVAAVALVGAAWLGWTYYAYRHGPQRVDTLWYHLPAAAWFVQNGSIGGLHYFDSGAITVFYPFNSELLHGFGLLMFGGDLLSPVINLGWAALAFGAAWAIGRPYARAPHCVVAVAIVLGGPGLIDTQPGGAYNDVVCVALTLCVAAILVNCRSDPRAGTVAAIAAGLALGTKFTMIAPVAALAVGAVFVWERDRRWRQALVWAVALLVCGGYWYVRNLVLVGNPLPSLALHLGPLSLPAPHNQTPSFTVAQYLTDSNVWDAFLLPGLRRSLGLAWPVVLVLFWCGSAAALGARDVTRRLLGAVALFSAFVFLVSPQALGLPGAPFFFVDNVRYAAPALALGLVLAGTLTPPAWARRWGDPWLLIGGLAFLATELDPGVWPSGIPVMPFDTPLRGHAAWVGVVAGLGLLAVGWARVSGARRRRSPVALVRRRRPVGLAAALIALVFGAGWALAHRYESGRFAAAAPLPRIYRWATPQRGLRIGIVGFTEQYPLYGAWGDNVVQYVGASRPNRGYAEIADCQDWRQAVARGRYGWLVIAPAGFPLGHGTGHQLAWTLAGGNARVVFNERPVGVDPSQSVALVQVIGPVRPSACAAGR